MSEIIKCMNCGHVLVSGSGFVYFPPGTSISCLKCGNKYTLGKEKPPLEVKANIIFIA